MTDLTALMERIEALPDGADLFLPDMRSDNFYGSDVDVDELKALVAELRRYQRLMDATEFMAVRVDGYWVEIEQFGGPDNPRWKTNACGGSKTILDAFDALSE